MSKQELQRESNVNWILSSPDPTPLAFFRLIHPTHRIRAIEKYKMAFAQALRMSEDGARLRKVKNDEETIQRDWETWLGEKKTISVSRSIHDTNVNIQKKFNSGVDNWISHYHRAYVWLTRANDVNDKGGDNESDEEGGEEGGENDAGEDCADSSEDNGGAIKKSGNDSDNAFVKRLEARNPSVHTRHWTLSSGTDVRKVLADYVQTIPDSQKCSSLAYWGILDLTEEHSETKGLFSAKDWTEMVNQFNDDVKLSRSKISKAMCQFFDEVHQLRCDTCVYGEICCWASAVRRNDDRSVVLRARVGQKCDFRGTLKHSIDNLEAIIGLRSGGLPAAHRRKVSEDRVDLAVAMRDILFNFFVSNTNAPDNDLHRTFILGAQSWGLTHDTFGMDCRATNLCRFGRLARTKLPNTTRTLACLEAFYALMLDVKVLLHTHLVSDSQGHLQSHERRCPSTCQGTSERMKRWEDVLDKQSRHQPRRRREQYRMNTFDTVYIQAKYPLRITRLAPSVTCLPITNYRFASQRSPLIEIPLLFPPNISTNRMVYSPS
ncbi:hypothetical protein BC936DRAFT_149144 [Jimgerdemannia flammicorona]|uniref:Uncharacterized protein n=1 Tax=Jimgerdemannia flammicorona TaxID=994334 RepID=A0A433D1G3_9FUNG|nr:hypothetical protein BC936DRAFT_149144 [Jimgerdemannia flammicorona]